MGEKELPVDLIVENVVKRQRFGTMLLVTAQNNVRSSEQEKSLEIVCRRD